MANNDNESMNPRELIILVLGLAIVAVVLRGLFLALRARRGQIKLSIDKNIPQDIDLEALELAELPGGGARVVERPNEGVQAERSSLDEAQERAAALDLGKPEPDDDIIPVLMDAVEVRNDEPDVEASFNDWDDEQRPDIGEIDSEAELEPEPKPEPEPSLSQAGEATPPMYSEQADPEPAISRAESEYRQSQSETGLEGSASSGPSIGLGLADDDSDGIDSDYLATTEPPFEAPFQKAEAGDEEEHAEEDDLLLDYGSEYDSRNTEVSDSLAQLAPDYPEESDTEGSGEKIEDAPEFEQQEYQVEPQHESSAQLKDEVIEDEQESEPENKEESTSESFEEQLEQFSMSAGERIGYGPETKVAEDSESAQRQPVSDLQQSDQTSLDVSDTEQASVKTQKIGPKSKSSFFSVFKRKPKEDADVDAERHIVEEINDPEQVSESDPLGASSQIEAPLPEPAEEPALAVAEELPDTRDVRSQEDSTQEHQTEKAATEPSEVMVMNVMAAEGYAFLGDDLLQVLITAGLKFGEMNIFHHHLRGNTKDPVLFSVANVLNPGTFDLNNMSDFSTMGVSFFLALPTSMKNMDAFETMLSVAQQVREGLGGELRDDQRNLMTAQTIEHYRQRVRDFELRQLKAGIRGN